MIRTLIAITLFVLAAPAYAQIYIHLGAAHASVKTNTVPSISDGSVSALPSIGYRFSKHIAAELSYLDTGKVEGSGAGQFRNWQAKGAGYALIGMFPLSEKFSLLGKLGAYSLDAEGAVSTGGGTPMAGITSPNVDLGTRPSIGAGVLYTFSPTIQMRLLVEQISGKDSIELDSIRLTTFGLVLNF